MDNKKCIEYVELKIANIDLANDLASVLDEIEKLKIKGRKINKKLESNKKKSWALAKELGMVKTTVVPQGEMTKAFVRGIEMSAKKKYVSDMLR